MNAIIEGGTIERRELDGTLVVLGVLVGLLEERGADRVAVNTGWFEDPLDGIKNLTSGGNERLFDLIGEVFPKEPPKNGKAKAGDGKTKAESGEPKTESGEGWHAVSYPDEGKSKKTPLNLVRKWEKDAGHEVTKDLIGLGFKEEYGSSLVVSPYLFVPVADRGDFVVGDKAHPIEAGVTIKSSERISTKAISFSGLKLSVKIHFDSAPEISDIMLFDLKVADGVTLPGLKEGATEIGLIQLFGDAPGKVEEWLEFVFELILAEITGEDAGSLGTALGNLRLLLGLSKKQTDDDEIPSIDWGKLTSDHPEAAFTGWLAKILFNDASRKTWLNALQCLLAGKDATDPENSDAIRGQGTKDDPYSLSVLSSWGGSSFAITFGADAAANGKRPLSVGLRLKSEAYELAHGIGIQFLATVDAGQFRVSQNEIKMDGVLRAFDVNVRVCNAGATTQNALPLFEYTPYPQLPPLRGEPEPKSAPPDTRLILGALQAGVHVRLGGDVHTPVPSLQFTGVTLGHDAFDLDLLTLKKRPAGAADADPFTDDFSKDNVTITKLLEVLGGALQDAWDRYQPSRYASIETNVERIIRGDDYRSIIDNLLKMSGKEVRNIPALLVKLGEWIGKTEPAVVPKEAFQWLIEGGNAFGVFGELLSLKIPEFSGEGSLLSYVPWPDFTVTIGKGPQSKGPQSKGPQSKGPQSKGPQSKGPQSKGPQSKGPQSKGTQSKGTQSKGTQSNGEDVKSAGKETDHFGIWLRPHAELDAVLLSGEASLIFENGLKKAPEVAASARFGLADASRDSLKNVGFDVNPELAVTLGKNASSFSVDFYPLGSGADDAFLMALLPDPLAAPYLAYKNKPERANAVEADVWMLRLLPRVLLPFFEEQVLNDDSVTKMLAKSPFSQAPEFTAATVLVDWGVLGRDDSQKFHLAKFDKLSELNAAGLLRSIVTAFKESVDKSGGFELLSIDKVNGDGIYLVSHQAVDAAYTDYGLRVQITDIGFGGKKKGAKKKPLKSKGSSKAVPKLQLGKWMRDEAESKPSENWIASSSKAAVPMEPGLTVNFLRLTDKDDASFEPSFELVSVGLDIKGGKGKPLFTKGGYQLQGLQSRLYFAWSEGTGTKFGAAIQLQEMGIPLGPKAGGDSGNKNPVAGNLLGSGGGAKGKEVDAVNPTFSAEVAYVNKFYGKIFSDIRSADGKAWIPVSRNIGPLHCRQIGLGLDSREIAEKKPDKKLDEKPKTEPWLGIGYDGGVALGPLNIDLDHLTIDIPLKRPKEISDYELGLAGLDVSYAGGPISISGGFFKKEVHLADETITTQYDGMALIKAADFTITGFGSYAVIGSDPSLFIFAVLHKDLGGPSFFHVTGLAAGFGYNRKLKLPPIEEVHNFPLVRGALEENYFDGADPQHSIQGAMEKLRDYIPPSLGDYWFAAGIRFSSFEMIESFALLSVSFGHEVEIGLLGMSKMTLPKGAKQKDAVAYAELALRVSIKPEEGSIAVEGRLTDESYIFSKDCRLTGGFAFFTWFSGPHSGDFVVTLGGYHPEFIRPPHYPIVPRLGINWQVSSELTVTAEMYFALTPSCLMAGGKLSAVFQSGCIKAWFIAYADFLLSWEPFYYTIDMGVTIGVEADLALFSINVELNVGLHLWGPPFAGEIDVDLDVVSFTISFGGPKMLPAPLTAAAFEKAFLPPPDPAKPKAAEPEVLATQINSGLIRQEIGKNKEPLRVVNAHALALSAQSLIPVTKFGGFAPKDRDASIKALDVLGVRPMGKTKLASAFSVRILNSNNVSIDSPDRHNLRVSEIENGVPEALWHKVSEEGKVPLPAAEAKTITVTVGIRISFDPKHPKGALLEMDIEKFAYETFNKPIPWDPNLKSPGGFVAGALGDENIVTVMSKKTTDKRSAVLDVLARQSPFDLNKVDLAELVKSRESYFQADPTLCRLGSLNESIA